MYVIPVPDRPVVSQSGPEKAQLAAWLDFYRAVLLLKCADLTHEQLAERAVPSTELTLMGILRHLVGVEMWWFQECLDGRDPGYPYDKRANMYADFGEVLADDPETVASWFDRAIDGSRRSLEAHELDDVAVHPGRDGQPIDLRWICHHMLEEYARHVGHADLIREAIDGAKGN
jgi:hypothetical protein